MFGLLLFNATTLLG